MKRSANPGASPGGYGPESWLPGGSLRNAIWLRALSGELPRDHQHAAKVTGSVGHHCRGPLRTRRHTCRRCDHPRHGRSGGNGQQRARANAQHGQCAAALTDRDDWPIDGPIVCKVSSLCNHELPVVRELAVAALALGIHKVPSIVVECKSSAQMKKWFAAQSVERPCWPFTLRSVPSSGRLCPLSTARRGFRADAYSRASAIADRLWPATSQRTASR
jgi:hypothetical protein